MTVIPAPFYSLIQTGIGDDPAYVVVNSALRTFAGRARFPWHLCVAISLRNVQDNGLPHQQEFEPLEIEEDRVTAAVTAEANAVFVAHVTCRGRRDVLFRVRDPEIGTPRCVA